MVIPAAGRADIMPSARVPKRSNLYILINAILEPTLLIHTSLVTESWIFQFTHDLP